MAVLTSGCNWKITIQLVFINDIWVEPLPYQKHIDFWGSARCALFFRSWGDWSFSLFTRFVSCGTNRAETPPKICDVGSLCGLRVHDGGVVVRPLEVEHRSVCVEVVARLTVLLAGGRLSISGGKWSVYAKNGIYSWWVWLFLEVGAQCLTTEIYSKKKIPFQDHTSPLNHQVWNDI